MGEGRSMRLVLFQLLGSSSTGAQNGFWHGIARHLFRRDKLERH